MRVTVIGPDYPLRGGIAHQVYCLKQELTGHGHQVQVISYSQLYPRLLFPGTTQLDTSAATLSAGGLPILNPVNPLTWTRAYRVVKQFAPDLVVFQWWHTFFGAMVGTLARRFRKAGIKCVLECHNVFPHETRKLDHSILRFATKPFEAFITHSNKVRGDLLPFAAGRRIGVSPLQVPIEFSGSDNQTRSGRTILFFGVVRKYKGLDVLLKAMPQVLSEVDCKLHIAGEFYDSIEKYRNLISENGLQEHVTIDDRYIPNEEIPAIFAAADVMVAPYLAATQSAVAAVAAANGLPLIVSRTGGLPETVIENETGMFFPAGDSEALANQIIAYFKNNLGPVFARNLRAQIAEDHPSLSRLIEELALDHAGEAVSSVNSNDPLNHTK